MKLNRLTIALATAGLVAGAPLAHAQTEAELKARIQQLESELEAAQDELDRRQREAEEQTAELRDVEARLAEVEGEIGPDKITFDIGGGELRVGGAMRANYAIGDYPETGAASRSDEDGGTFELDTFRFNIDYTNGPWLAELEYRFYQNDFIGGGYNMLHTGWVGYNFEDGAQVQVGVNRVPFGPGPYGVSQSWFFDQHYYVGLSDDMDLGAKYTRPMGDWVFDVAYYYSDEGQWTGSRRDSARYSYDVVNESGDGYEERNQFNLRGIYSIPEAPIETDLGFSLQYGELESDGPQDDGEHYAASAHMVNKWGNFTLASQLTWFEFDVDDDFLPPLRDTKEPDEALSPVPTGSVVQMGAYDFANEVAAEGWIPAVSLSYYQATPGIEWLDYVIPYVEYSSIVKEESGFNDSELFIVGAAFARGGWYIYTDLAFSNGNEFVGGDADFEERLAANPDDEWQTRFNINFGYYF